MQPKGPSRTAVTTASHRATDPLLDDDPKIVADPFARALAGCASDAEMLEALSTELNQVRGQSSGNQSWQRARISFRKSRLKPA
jgi:O-methyltransferase involved in polyketide biosynthesis